jgi:hypothetical protein
MFATGIECDYPTIRQGLSLLPHSDLMGLL